MVFDESFFQRLSELKAKYSDRVIAPPTPGVRTFSYTGQRVGQYLLPLIHHARKRLWVVSPMISHEYAELLVRKAKSGVDVRVITSDEDEAMYLASNGVRVKLIASRLVHVKLYICDNVVVTGSVNLTKSGLWSNIERIEIKKGEKALSQAIATFLKLWSL